jgi:hypothetical protein
MPPASTSLRPLWVAAAWLGRSQDTVRDWYKRGLLTKVACDVQTRQLLVDLVEVERLHRQRPARAPRRRKQVA